MGQAASHLANRKELHHTVGKEMCLKAEREWKEGNYQQRVCCYRHGLPPEGTEGPASKRPSADREAPQRLSTGSMAGGSGTAVR